MTSHGFRREAQAAAALIVFSFFRVKATEWHPASRTDSTSDYYKTQCLSCHGDKAELKFDQKLPEEEVVRIVLKGKLVDDPPDMPAFEEKGVTPQEAKALVTYMRQLRRTANGN